MNMNRKKNEFGRYAREAVWSAEELFEGFSDRRSFGELEERSSRRRAGPYLGEYGQHLRGMAR